MKTRLASLLAVALAASSPAAFAQSQQPLLSVSMTEVDVLANNPPYDIFGSNPIYDGTGNNLPLNGGYGPYGTQINMWALATGTSPEGGFTYTFFVNGVSVGTAINQVPTQASVSAGTPTPTPLSNWLYPQGVSWTPPQPGTYYLSVQASDGQHTATSLAVEYFATGISIVSPVPNSIIPLGSSVVIQAAAAIPDGAVSKVAFYVDGGPTTGGTLLGTSTNYPYSIIYTPTGPVGTVHYLEAVSYLSDGVTIAAISPGPNGIVVVDPVQPTPMCSIGSPAQTTPPTTIPIPDYVSNPSAFIPVTVNVSSPYTIQKVELYINGVLYGTDTALPYNFDWTPSVGGTYYLTALAYDNKNNVIASTTSTTSTLTPAPTTVVIGSLPSVAITQPTSGATLSGGSTTAITATATDNNVDSNGNPIPISQVQFYQDGGIVGTAQGVAGVTSYTVSFTPVQKINSATGLVEDSELTAIATDALGFQGVSAAVEVSVTAGGSSGSVVVGTPPTVSLTSPTEEANVVVNTPVTLNASASAPNGNVSTVSFLVDDIVVSTVSKYPYSAVWTPTNLGFYTISAQVIDNLGDKTNSTPITVFVIAPPPPTVGVTSPSSGSILTVGSPVTITANAASSSGTIASVAFYEDGTLIGTSTTQPYSVSFTPQSAGILTLSAVATDYAGQVTTSSTITVEAAPSTGGVNTIEYFGNYVGLTDGGVFAFAMIDGAHGAYIGIPTSGTKGAVTYTPDLTVSSGGTFSASTISGTVSSVGVSGNLLPGEEELIGGVPSAASYSVAAGYYSGSLGGVANSQVAAIVGPDGEIVIYVANGAVADAGYGASGTVQADGTFTVNTYGNNTITGTINPANSLLTGAFSGSSGGTIIGGRVSGGVFSDGVLRNISTRGLVGTGSNSMIAGFVVGGSASKQLLVRAVGPALSNFGLTGVLAAPQLSIYQGSTLIASNAGWSSTPTNASAVASADSQAGAFALTSGSADSALVGTFAPGAYTAIVSGNGGGTGLALVEVYDLDTYTPFMTNKLVDVSTRANVGSGSSLLIGGFVINGVAPKKVLIRGAGPSLGALGVSGALATPHLQLVQNGTVIRENYSWQLGNDGGLVTAAEKAAGAFEYASGSADSAILMVLYPGTYTVELSGAGTSTGVALIEVYDVP